MISEIFLITRYNSDFVVTWPGRRAVTSQLIIVKLFNLAFETGAYSVSFSNTAYRWTIDSTVYYKKNAEKMCSQIVSINSIGFAQERHALDFIDRAEKAIVWNLLRKSYITTIGDLI